MKGQKIKEILKAEGISIIDVAKMLGYESDQRLHNALRSDDVKSGLIEDIARVTNKSVCDFYEMNGNAIATENSLAISGNSNQVSTISEKFIALLEKKDEQMDRLIGIIERNK